MDKEREKELEYQKLYSDWIAKEKEYEETKLKEKQKEQKKEEELKKLIDDDLNYDSADDKDNKNSLLYSKHHKGIHKPIFNYIEKRRLKREKEAERDEEDREKEKEEIRIEEERQEEERKRIEELKKAKERKIRPKSRFTEIKDPQLSTNENPLKSISEQNTEDMINQAQISIPPPQNSFSDYNEGNVSRGEYFTPANAPPGARPLRTPGISVQGKSLLSLMNTIDSLNDDDMEISNQQTTRQVENNNPGFQMMDVDSNLARDESALPESADPATGQVKRNLQVESTFAQAAEEDYDSNVHTQAAKDANDALNERLKQIELKRKEIEDKMKEEQKENSLENYQKEDKKEILEKVKQIYYSLPSNDNDILEYPLNWEALLSLNIIDAVMQKIVSTRVKDILHVEEPSLIRWVLDTLKKKPTPQYIRQHLYNVLDEATDGFVVSIWRAMIFENKKYDQHIITEPFKAY